MRQSRGGGSSGGSGSGSGAGSGTGGSNVLGRSAEALQILQALTSAEGNRAESAAAAVAAAATAGEGEAGGRDSEEGEETDPRLLAASMSGEVRDIMARFKARTEAKAASASTGTAGAEAESAENSTQKPEQEQGGEERGSEAAATAEGANEEEDEQHDYLMVSGGGGDDNGDEDDGDDDGDDESKEEGSQAEEKEGSEPPGDAKSGAVGGEAVPVEAEAEATTGGKAGKPPEIGPGEYLLRVVYAKGATMRDGVEIDHASVVGNLPCGSIVVATARVICSCGIPRFKIPNGWISEWLRGGMEELVVEVLHHRPREPLRYQIICTGGAMVRKTASISGPEAKGGGCAHGTIVSVAERLRLPDGTMRLRVVDPPHNVGWISEKDHIVRREVRRKDCICESLFYGVVFLYRFLCVCFLCCACVLTRKSPVLP